MRHVVALLAALLPATASAAAPHLVEDARIVWRAPDEGFGGFSGLALLPDGQFLTVSDRGHWARGHFERSGGTLTGARLDAIGPLHSVSGAPLDGDDVDAEALVLDADGRAYVSFEAFHRIRRYDAIDGPAAVVDGHPDFSRLQLNSGLEALTMDAAGTLYAIPERSGRWERPYPVYRLRDGRWDKDLRLRRDGTFLVSDATFGPDGRLYVLERDFKWLGGFATRLRRFDIGPDGVSGEVTLLQTPFGELDNMESIQVWRDDTGRTRVTLLSDDNFFPLQQTMFVEYLLVGE